MDLLGLAALGLVAADWLALGWLSGIAWPHTPETGASASFWAPRWALRLLVGAFLVALAQLALALAGIGFETTALVLVAAAVPALGLRLLARSATRAARPASHAVQPGQ